MQALVEGFQRAFATDGIPEEHDQKVNHIVVAEAAAGKAHAFTDGGKDILLAKVLSKQGDFAEPGGVEGTDWEKVWMITDPSAILFM